MPTSLAIPTIDLDRDDKEILPALERALCNIGFVLVKGHDVPAELLSNLRRYLIDYFDRPLADKMAGGSGRCLHSSLRRPSFLTAAVDLLLH